MNTSWSLGSFQFGRHPFAGWKVDTNAAADLAEAVGYAYNPDIYGGGRCHPTVAMAHSLAIIPYIKTKPTVLNVLWGTSKYVVKKWTGSEWAAAPLDRPVAYTPSGDWATERKWDGQEWVVTTTPETPTEPSGTWVVKRRWNGSEWEVLGQEWVA